MCWGFHLNNVLHSSPNFQLKNVNFIVIRRRKIFHAQQCKWNVSVEFTINQEYCQPHSDDNFIHHSGMKFKIYRSHFRMNRETISFNFSSLLFWNHFTYMHVITRTADWEFLLMRSLDTLRLCKISVREWERSLYILMIPRNSASFLLSCSHQKCWKKTLLKSENK